MTSLLIITQHDLGMEEIEENNYDLDQEIKFDSEEKIEEEKKEPSGTQFTLDSF